MKHIVGVSGGIDSQATALWVRNRYPAEDVILLNSDAGGNESPITTAFIEEYSRDVFPVLTISAIIADMWETPGYAEKRGYCGTDRLTFGLMMSIKQMPPSRKKQFCTEKLKLVPQRRWMREAFGPGGIYEGEEFIRYAGVRRDESNSRATAPYSEWDNYYDCELVRPIMDWTKPMCFEYVRAHREAVNPLYSLGFARVGCAPCINSSKADIRAWADRDPSMIDKIRGWEQSTGITYFMPVHRDGVPNTVDAVLDWARRDWRRGGELLVLPERPSCESKYGLCA